MPHQRGSGCSAAQGGLTHSTSKLGGLQARVLRHELREGRLDARGQRIKSGLDRSATEVIRDSADLVQGTGSQAADLSLQSAGAAQVAETGERAGRQQVTGHVECAGSK